MLLILHYHTSDKRLVCIQQYTHSSQNKMKSDIENWVALIEYLIIRIRHFYLYTSSGRCKENIKVSKYMSEQTGVALVFYPFVQYFCRDMAYVRFYRFCVLLIANVKFLALAAYIVSRWGSRRYTTNCKLNCVKRDSYLNFEWWKLSSSVRH